MMRTAVHVTISNNENLKKISIEWMIEKEREEREGSQTKMEREKREKEARQRWRERNHKILRKMIFYYKILTIFSYDDIF